MVRVRVEVTKDTAVLMKRRSDDISRTHFQAPSFQGEHQHASCKRRHTAVRVGVEVLMGCVKHFVNRELSLRKSRQQWERVYCNHGADVLCCLAHEEIDVRPVQTRMHPPWCVHGQGSHGLFSMYHTGGNDGAHLPHPLSLDSLSRALAQLSSSNKVKHQHNRKSQLENTAYACA